MPKLKEIRFAIVVIERRRRCEASVEEAMIEMRPAGVSAKRIEDVSEILWGVECLGRHCLETQGEGLRIRRGAVQQTARKGRFKESRLREAAKAVEDGCAEMLAYTRFPRERWRRIRANEVIDRLDREIRRRTREVGAFPDGKSALLLVTARLKYVAESEWGSRRYLDVALLEGQPHRTAGLWCCWKAHKNLDGTYYGHGV